MKWTKKDFKKAIKELIEENVREKLSNKLIEITKSNFLHQDIQEFITIILSDIEKNGNIVSFLKKKRRLYYFADLLNVTNDIVDFLENESPVELSEGYLIGYDETNDLYDTVHKITGHFIYYLSQVEGKEKEEEKLFEEYADEIFSLLSLE